MKIRAMSAAAAVVLAGCGGGGGVVGQNPPEDFITQQTAFDAVEGRLAARSNTAFIPPLIEGMPSSGTARYEGYLFAELDTAGETTQLYGQATVNANFTGGTMSGTAANFVGRDRTGAEDTYSGQVSFTGGKIGVDRPNDFDLPYAGTLAGNGETVVMSGKIDGDFKGDPIRGILGTDAMTGTVAGTSYSGTVTLAAEVVP